MHSNHTSKGNLVLNLDDDLSRKLTRLKIKVENKPCTILLDSCATVSIVSEVFVKEYLNKDSSEIYGPVSCIRGIGNTRNYHTGKIDLRLEIFENIYTETFVVMNNPGIPGNILLSAMGMGRCGLTVDFENKLIKSNHSEKEAVFVLEEAGFQVNRRRLQETSTSEGKALHDHDLYSNRNVEQYHPMKIKRYYSYRRNKERSALLRQDDKRGNISKNNTVIKATSNHDSGGNEYSRNSVQRNIENNKDNGIKKCCEYTAVNNENIVDDSKSRILDVAQQINKIKENKTLVSRNKNSFEKFPDVKGCYLVRNEQRDSNLTEVLYLGQVPMSRINRVIDNDSSEEDVADEYAYFVKENEKEDDVFCISPNDDFKIKFKINYPVSLMPSQCTRVNLIVQDRTLDVENKEIILQTFANTPENLQMDNSLVKLKGMVCDTYVCNNTNLRIDLNAGETFCEGIVLEHALLGITEDAFCAATGIENEDMGQEIKNIHFAERKVALMNLLNKYRNVVALSGEKLGGTDISEHKILLQPDAKPFFIPNYRLPISRREIIDDMIKEMKADGVVRDSKSPYNSPLLLVPKKDNTWRMVVDYRRLNQQTIPDRFPMPVINDVLSQLGGAKVFTSLDLLSGYWQIPLSEESKPLTAFSTHKEHLEFNSMPFGLTGAPLTFSRVMLTVLGHIKNVFVYLDDVIIFSEDLDHHLATLEEVLASFQKAGLKIKLRKCQFLQRELEYLGHKINEEGIMMQEGKISAILEYPHPVNVKSLRRFLGMIGYYRPFIQNFSSIAHPLTELLKQDKVFRWDEEQNKAFEKLKACLISDPILVYPDFKQEFYLATDASSTGLGAVLMQKRKTRMRVISYASRVMNDTEKRYSTTERECLALFWGLKKFKHLILGYKVNILTDHKPLLDLYKKRDFINNSKFNRWFLAILEFGPEIKYIPGTSNTLADGLSRTFEEEEPKVENKKFCLTCRVVELDLNIVKIEQEKDEDIIKIKGALREDANARTDFEEINGLLYKKPVGDTASLRLYIPKTLIREVLYLTHSHKLAGHPGLQKTKDVVKRNYFWPGCSKDVEDFVTYCEICNLHKGSPNVPAPLERYPTELYPFQVVSMDFVGPMPATQRSNKYILVFIDYLTRWVEIVPCRDRLASTVAEAVKKRIIVQHSTPEVLLSDNAPEYTGEIMTKLCEFFEIKKVHTTPYKPSSNGAVERANQKIKNILRTLITPDNLDWDKTLEDVQLVINNSVNCSTGETPHFLLYGYSKRMPVTLCDDATPPKQCYNYDSYIEQRLKQYYSNIRKARKELNKSQGKWELYYKSREKKSVKIGSRVFILKQVPQGPNFKVSPKFEGPYRVIEIMKGNKFKLVHEKDSSERIAHYNHLKVVNMTNESWLQKIPHNDENNHDVVATPPSPSSRYNLRDRN